VASASAAVRRPSILEAGHPEQSDAKDGRAMARCQEENHPAQWDAPGVPVKAKYQEVAEQSGVQAIPRWRAG